MYHCSIKWPHTTPRPQSGVGGVKPGAVDLHHPLLGAASLLQQPVMVQADQTPHQSSLASFHCSYFYINIITNVIIGELYDSHCRGW